MLEFTLDRLDEVRALFNAAISEIPTSADLRRRFVEFETKQGNLTRAKEIEDSSVSFGLLL